MNAFILYTHTHTGESWRGGRDRDDRRYERGSHPQQRSLEDRYDPYGSDGYRPQRRSLEDRSEWGRKSDQLPKGMCWQWGGKKRAQWLLSVRIQVQPITPPPERPRLQLQPRSKPPEDTSGRRERGGRGGR